MDIMEVKTESADEVQEEITPDNVPPSPWMEKDSTEEEEIPPAEVVTVYFEDETVQENAECVTSDPLALDACNENTCMSIKEELVDELAQSQHVVECENEHTIIKTENLEDEFMEFNNASASYWSKEITEDANCDNSNPNIIHLQSIVASVESSNTYGDEFSTFESSTPVPEESCETAVADVEKVANVRTSIRLRKKQDRLGTDDRKSRGIWQSATLVKQERLQLSMSSKSKNQMLNSFMVQVPLLGFKKYKRGGISGPVTCEFCGKLFGGVTSLWGHLSTCRQRYRQRNNPASLTLPKRVMARKAIPKADHEMNNGLADCSVSEKKNKKTRLLVKSTRITNDSNDKFKCNVCGKVFLSQSGLYKHMNKHPKFKEYECETCQSAFNYCQNLRRHCKSQRHKALIYTCSVCDKQFYSRFAFKSHETSHDITPPELEFGCSACDKAFDSALKLQRHSARCKFSVEENTNDKPKKSRCSVCGNQYKSMKRLLLHMKWHSNSKNNRCPVCKKKFDSRGALRRHKLVHRQENKFCCDMCDKIFFTRRNLNQHKHRHKGSEGNGLTCARCHQTFIKSTALWEHYVYCRAHMANSYSVTKHAKKNSKLNVLKHIQRNSKMLVRGKEQIQTFRTTTQPVGSQNTLAPRSENNKCDLCMKTFSSMHCLVRHQLIHYGQLDASSDDQNGILCVICGCKFTSNITLLRHQQFHKVGNRFQCLLCKKNFETARNLKIHMHTHRMESENLHKCDECGKNFSSQVHLKFHQRTHIGLYSCAKCFKTFESRQGLAGHANHCPYRFSAVNEIAPLINKTSPKKISSKLSALQSPQVVQKEYMNSTSASRKLHMPKDSQSSTMYSCNTCNKKFSSTLLLKYHIRQHAGDANSLTCNNCKKTFVTPHGLKGHMSHCPVRRVVMDGLLSRKDDTLQCHICGKTTNTITNYISHMRTHADTESITCTVCGAAFVSKKARRTHAQHCHKGFNSGGFSCKRCTERFDNRSAFMKHYATCGKLPIKQVKKPKNSMKEVKPYKPIHSGEILKKPARSSETLAKRDSQLVNYALHESDFVEENKEALLIEQFFHVLRSGATGPEKWGCKVCKKVLTAKSNLKFHCYLHTGDSPFKCGICGKRMLSRGALKQHLKKIHKVPEKKLSETQIVLESTNTEEKQEKPASPVKTTSPVTSNIGVPSKKVFECDICSRTFDIVSSLRTHKETHSRLLRCSACGGSYRTLREFREHICADYFISLCEHCGMQFTDDSMFSSHLCSENSCGGE